MRVGPPKARVLACVLGSVLWLLVVAACSSGVPNSPADQSYLGAVHAQASDIGRYRSDVALVRLGRAACDGFRSGASYEELADRMALEEGRNPLPSQDLGAVISAAADNYCPQYRARV